MVKINVVFEQIQDFYRGETWFCKNNPGLKNEDKYTAGGVFGSVRRRKRAQDASVAASGSVLRLSLLKGISAQIVAAAVRRKHKLTILFLTAFT